MSRELVTERLLLRQWRQEDFEEFSAFYADEQMAHFVGGIHTREQAWRRMALFAGHWALRGFGYWAVEERETGALAGGVGLWRPEEWPDLELGYWLVRAAQGKGYAVEAGVAARDHAFDVLGAEALVSYVHPDNEASMKVAERLGATRDGMIELLSYGPHWVYRYPRTTARRVTQSTDGDSQE